MIGTQTKALFVDAYRDLNARKLFWVVLILNVLAVLAFAALGVKDNRLNVLGWEPPQDFSKGLPIATFIYKWVFSYVVVGKWLTWVATILALISTASIFPDFLSGGTIDLYLSKPIGRLRLFLTKYLTGLLFVALQVGVFTVGSFVVLGVRGGTWEPGLFWAIPIVVLFFSYLFSICVLFGVLTRSTLAAFFLTLVAWFGIFSLNAADRFLMEAEEIYAQRAESAQRRVSRLDQQIAFLQAKVDKAATQPAAQPGAAAGQDPDAQQLRRLQADRGRAAEEATRNEPPGWVQKAQPIVFAVNAVVPKTQDTIGLLDRALFDDMILQMALEATPDRGPMRGWRANINRLLRGQSKGWVLGSSIAFEAVMLGLASWRFCRRDF